jgi:hypothetical protein
MSPLSSTTPMALSMSSVPNASARSAGLDVTLCTTWTREAPTTCMRLLADNTHVCLCHPQTCKASNTSMRQHTRGRAPTQHNTQAHLRCVRKHRPNDNHFIQVCFGACTPFCNFGLQGRHLKPKATALKFHEHCSQKRKRARGGGRGHDTEARSTSHLCATES